MKPRVSVVIPAYNEGAAIGPFLDRIFEAVTLPAEVLVVHDTMDDTTVPFLAAYAQREPRLRAVLNTLGRGPANALRFGIAQATADVVVVTMADGSDDPMQIDQLSDSSNAGSSSHARRDTCVADSRLAVRGSRGASRVSLVCH